MFSIRILTTDHYQSSPIPGLDVQYSEFQNADVYKVPVIRVYGSTPAGQKTCMHIHGVFPYLYVPYDGTQPWDRYMQLFASSLDKAINVAQGHASSNIQHVYKITLVCGIPMYGYHPKEQQFLKIYFYNPGIVRKAADLLLGGAVMNKGFQPHESHIPYTLQMFIDYNLYGMNMINLAALKFRRTTQDDNGNPVDITEDNKSDDSEVSPQTPVASLTHIIDTSVLNSSGISKIWNEESIPSDMYMASEVVKQSVCELEVDVVAADILNRQEVDANIGANPGLAALWDDERQRRRDKGDDSQIVPTQSQERKDVIPSDSDLELTQRFKEIVHNQRMYRDSQSETTSVDSQDDFQSTQLSSVVDMHLSGSGDDSSQGTVMLEEEDYPVPIVSIDSIKRVVSMSQSFSNTPPSQLNDVNEDKTLAEILASLADENSSPSSQAAANEVMVLEEKDSILIQKSHVPDEEAVQQDEDETLEMSQVVWNNGSEDDQEDGKRSEKEEYDLAGLDTTWNVSQLSNPEMCDSDEDLSIPQLDGANDEKPKPAPKKARKKRLGTNGPITTFDQMVAEARKHGVHPNHISGYNMCSNSSMIHRMNSNLGSNPQSEVQSQQIGQFGQGQYRHMNWTNSVHQMPGYGMHNWGSEQMNAYSPWQEMLNSPDFHGAYTNDKKSPLPDNSGQLMQERYNSQGVVSLSGRYNNDSGPSQEHPNPHGNKAQEIQNISDENSTKSLTSPHSVLQDNTSQEVPSPQSNISSPHGFNVTKLQSNPTENYQNSVAFGNVQNRPQSFIHSSVSLTSSTGRHFDQKQFSHEVQGSHSSPVQHQVMHSIKSNYSVHNIQSSKESLTLPHVSHRSSVQHGHFSQSFGNMPSNISSLQDPSRNMSSQSVSHPFINNMTSSDENTMPNPHPPSIMLNAGALDHSNKGISSSHQNLSSPHGSISSSHGSMASPHSSVQSPSAQSKIQMPVLHSQNSASDSLLNSSQDHILSPIGFNNSNVSSSSEEQWNFPEMSTTVEDQSRGPPKQFNSLYQAHNHQQYNSFSSNNHRFMETPEFQMQQYHSSSMKEVNSLYNKPSHKAELRQNFQNSPGDYSAHGNQQMNHIDTNSLAGSNFAHKTHESTKKRNSNSENLDTSTNSNCSGIISEHSSNNDALQKERSTEIFGQSSYFESSLNSSGGSSSLFNSLKEAFNFAGNHLREVNSSQNACGQNQRPEENNLAESESMANERKNMESGSMYSHRNGMENGSMFNQRSNLESRNMLNQMNSMQYGGSFHSSNRLVSDSEMHHSQNYQDNSMFYSNSESNFGSSALSHYSQQYEQPHRSFHQDLSSYNTSSMNYQSNNSNSPQATMNGTLPSNSLPGSQIQFDKTANISQYSLTQSHINHQSTDVLKKPSKPRKPRKPREKKVKDCDRKDIKNVCPAASQQGGNKLGRSENNLLEKLLLAPEDSNDSSVVSGGKTNLDNHARSGSLDKRIIRNSFDHSSSSSVSSSAEPRTKKKITGGNSGTSPVLSTANNESFKSGIYASNSENAYPFREKEVRDRERSPENQCTISSLQTFVSSHNTQYGVKVKNIATDGKPYSCKQPYLNKVGSQYGMNRGSNFSGHTIMASNDPTIYLPDEDFSPTYMSLDDSFNSGMKATSLEELIRERNRVMTPYVDKNSTLKDSTNNSMILNSTKKGKRGSLVRSFSTPVTVKKRRGRPPKNPDLKPKSCVKSFSSDISDMNDFKPQKSRKMSKERSSVGNKYSFVFHIPTYCFKRLKIINMGRKRNTQNTEYVRMHPMDARRYSLLKVGREIVRIPKLSKQHIAMGSMGQIEDLQELLIMSGVDVIAKRKSSMIGYESETDVLMKSIEEEKRKHIAKSSNIQKMIVPEKQLLSDILPETNCYNIEKVSLASIIDHCFQQNMTADGTELEPSSVERPQTLSSNENYMESEKRSNTESSSELKTTNDSMCSSSGISCPTLQCKIPEKMRQCRTIAGLIEEKENNRNSMPDVCFKQTEVSNLREENIAYQKNPENLIDKTTSDVKTNKNALLKVLHGQNDKGFKDTEKTVSRKDSRPKSKKDRKLNIRTFRKQNKLKLHKKLPLVIDPDQEEQDDVILHDVSLLEASDGTLTPFRSRTPVAGRSPIRPNIQSDPYHLVGTDIEEFESKWKMLHSDNSETASLSSKSESQSRSSSRTNSECDAVPGVNQNDEVDAYHIGPVNNNSNVIGNDKRIANYVLQNQVKLNSVRTQRNKNSLIGYNDTYVHCGQHNSKKCVDQMHKTDSISFQKGKYPDKDQLQSRSRSHSPVKSNLMNENVSKFYIVNMRSSSVDRSNLRSHKDCKELNGNYDLGKSESNGKIVRKRKKIDPGVHFVVTGKFKGHKKMGVRLQKLDIQNGSVNIGSLLKDDTAGMKGKFSCDISETKSTFGNVFERFVKLQQSCPYSVDSSLDPVYDGKGASEKAINLQTHCFEDSNLDLSKDEQQRGIAGDYSNELLETVSSDNEDIIDSDSCSDDKQETQTMKKKKRLTKNQRLHMAFASASYKTRRKKSPVHSGKLMANLSLLHQATLANLNESTENYGECLQDYRTVYDDAMYKMSLLSPLNSEAGDVSPPQPHSPGEILSHINATTRSTSEVLSPVVSTTTNSSPLSNASGYDLSPVYPPTMENDTKHFSISLEESPIKSSSRHSDNQVIAKRKILQSSNDQTFEKEDSDSSEVIIPSPEAVNSSKTVKFYTLQNFSNVKRCIQSSEKKSRSFAEHHEIKRKRKLGPLHVVQRAVVKLSPLSTEEIEKYCGKCCSQNDSLTRRSQGGQECEKTVTSLSNDKNFGVMTESVLKDVPVQEKKEIKDKSSEKPKIENGDRGISASFHSQDSGENNTRKRSEDGSPNPRKRTCGLTLSRGNQKLIYIPSKPPPSRESVRDSAVTYGLKITDNKEAFFSNPDDAPERCREVGGRVLSVQCSRVKDLPEFKNSIACTGLSDAQRIIAANEQILDLQSQTESIFEKLSRDFDFRFSIFGDKTVTITPVKPPPSKLAMKIWLQKCDYYKDLKLKINGKHRSLEDGFKQCIMEKKNDLNDSKDSSFLKIKHFDKLLAKSTNCENEKKSKTSKSDPVKTKNSIQTSIDDKRSTLFPSPSIDEIDDDIISPSPPKSQIKVKDSTCFSERLSKRIRLSQGNVTPTTHRVMLYQQDPNLSGSTTPTTSNVVSPVISCDSPKPSNTKSSLHSTPLTIKRLDKLFQASLTPIEKNGRVNDKSMNKGTGFLTPKKIPLPKRLSINSVNRKLITPGQDFSTPASGKNVSQIDGPTPKNSFGFKVSQQNLQEAKALHEVQNLTVISLELHAESRRDLRPDPEVDPIIAVFYCIQNDTKDEELDMINGVIIVDPKSAQHQKAKRARKTAVSSSAVSTEPEIRNASPQPSTSRSRSPQPSTSKDTSSSKIPGFTNSQKGKRSKSRSPSPRPLRPLQDTDYIEDTLLEKSGVDNDLHVTYVEHEEELFEKFMSLISRWDPDILVGYEIQNFSWGYLLQRASHLSINLCAKMSRIPDDKKRSSYKAESDEWGADHSSEIHIAGRVILNLWRLLRHEVALNIYTYENISFHVLHERVPHYSFQTLNSWFSHRTHLYRWRFIHHYRTRVEGNMRIIEQLDLIGRTSEFARVFGIEFYHVLSRGSQYRVESMMLRLAKPMNFIPVSPSVHQRARMKSPECIPLTLEPESRFYPDPVVVLDFQSLYPSIMIAHNYCFSTCVGRLDYLDKAYDGPIDFGCTHLKITPSTLEKIKDDVTVSPNGVVFVKQHIRKGIISSMVEEILNTRIMVKKSMKEHKKDKGLHRLLDARQLGLKLIANVTFGYTAANFSGRMPCVEVGDSIVRKARETLERAIKLVEDTPRWGAKVVYGDTDSMFIEFKGRSKDEAFTIGHEICDAVTAMNPKPIKLKFEKVYLPCVLQTKKRYVGFSYETPEQKEPVFDAKGIETVRRDSCSAVSKILERTIKILFTSRDVSLVKDYVLKQCEKLMQGKVSMQDCIFAKEYRGMKSYKPGACVPALEIAKKNLRQDRRSEPRVGERIPYVIVYGSPGLPLIQLVRQPYELLLEPNLRINATYYITKQILPPLDRLLSLLGVDVFTWYNEMPKTVRVVPLTLGAQEKKKGTISQFFSTTNCPVCDKQTNQSICHKCMQNPQIVCVSLSDRIKKWEKVYHELVQICNTCMGVIDQKQPCDSLDCPIMFRRQLAKQDLQKGEHLREMLNKVLDF